MSRIEEENPRAAKRVAKGITDAVKALPHHPWLGRMVPEYEEKTLREKIYRPYRIMYEVQESQNVIEILGVFRTSQLLPEDPHDL